MDSVLSPPPPPPPRIRTTPPASSPQPSPRGPGGWWRTFRAVGATIVTIVFASLIINASDNLKDLSNSLLGSTLITSEQVSSGHCPEDMVFVDAPIGGFCVDRYENSPSDACPNQIPQTQTQTRDNLTADDCMPESTLDRMPWVAISQNQAVLACAKAGKRLPTNEEWYRASLGTPESSAEKDDCSLHNNGVVSAQRTGGRPRCQSSGGAFDMVGNVWEWVDGTIYGGMFNEHRLPPEGYVRSVGTDGIPTETHPENADPNYFGDYFWVNHDGTRAMFRGGYWGVGKKGGFYTVHAISPPSFVGTAVGFRCAKDRDGT